MQITIERENGDGLMVRSWDFDVSGGYDGVYLRLTRYTEGTRPTRRHKIKGQQWYSGDERSYCSALPRPTSIPDDVIAEAMSKIEVKVAIGWTRDKDVIGKRQVTMSARA